MTTNVLSRFRLGYNRLLPLSELPVNVAFLYTHHEKQSQLYY
jgi:hypothetical protein